MSASPDNVKSIWKSKLRYRSGKDGQPELVPALDNVALLLTHDPLYAGAFKRDTFAQVVRVARSLPPIPGFTAPAPGVLSDHDVDYVCSALSTLNRCQVSAEMAIRAINMAAYERAYNPLRDYLDSIQWDAKPRLDRWLVDYFGAADTPYVRAVGRWWLISAVARAYRPGCQVDNMIVLEGAQGVAKSAAIAILGGEFTLRKLPSLRDETRAAHALVGHWIVEVGELNAFKGAAASQIKDFVSLPADTYRPPYGRLPITNSRACVFIGTTNEEHYLHDPTGGRRYWPVPVGSIDRRALTRDRDRLFAEAVAAFKAGSVDMDGRPIADIDRPPETRWWPPNPSEAGSDAILAELRASLDHEQSERQEYQTDPWREIVVAWMEGKGSGMPSSRRDGVTTREVLSGALDMRSSDMDRSAETRVGTILRCALGLVPKQNRENNVRIRRYWRSQE